MTKMLDFKNVELYYDHVYALKGVSINLENCARKLEFKIYDSSYKLRKVFKEQRDFAPGWVNFIHAMTLFEMTTSTLDIGGRELREVFQLLTAPGSHLSTVQLGIGGIPNAVLEHLRSEVNRNYLTWLKRRHGVILLQLLKRRSFSSLRIVESWGVPKDTTPFKKSLCAPSMLH